jgi:hypothetical protein
VQPSRIKRARLSSQKKKRPSIKLCNPMLGSSEFELFSYFETGAEVLLAAVELPFALFFTFLTCFLTFGFAVEALFWVVAAGVAWF